MLIMLTYKTCIDSEIVFISSDMCSHLNNQVIFIWITLKLLAVTKNKVLEYDN